MLDLEGLVLSVGDDVDVDGEVIEVDGRPHLAPLGDPTGPDAGRACGPGVRVQLPPNSPLTLGGIATVRGVWTGAGIEARTADLALAPRSLASLHPAPSDVAHATVASEAGGGSTVVPPRDPELEAVIDYLVGDEVAEDLMFAFGETRDGGRWTGQAWFTHMTPQVAQRLQAVPAGLLSVDVWLRPA